MVQRDRSLDHLADKFKPVVYELLARFTDARIPVYIIETLRSEEAHQEDLKNGRSWVQHSKHQDGLAIDICPLESYTIHGDNKLEWNGGDPVWEQLGQIGEKLGLTWGGRWHQKDLGHFELKD